MQVSTTVKPQARPVRSVPGVSAASVIAAVFLVSYGMLTPVAYAAEVSQVQRQAPPSGAATPTPVAKTDPAAKGKAAEGPSGVELAALRRSAVLISEHSMTDLFQPVAEALTSAEGVLPEAPLPGARHVKSGLACVWEENQGVQLHVYPGSPRGDDVSCRVEGEGYFYTLYATDIGTGYELSDIFDANAKLLKELGSFAGDDSPPKQPGVIWSKFIAPKNQIGYFVSKRNPQGETEVLAMALIDGWAIKMRYTGPRSSKSRAEQIWAQSLRWLDANRNTY